MFQFTLPVGLFETVDKVSVKSLLNRVAYNKGNLYLADRDPPLMMIFSVLFQLPVNMDIRRPVCGAVIRMCAVTMNTHTAHADLAAHLDAGSTSSHYNVPCNVA